MSGNWLIYGANGYTGRLIAREAARRGLKPILAGRDVAKVDELARQLDCPSRVFALDDDVALRVALQDATVVLNCAGPFSKTAPAMIAGCLQRRASYLDITGEIDVIEHAAKQDAAAREAGVSLIPAVGFDVVPTDCLAALLADEMPDATHLALAFHGSGAMSPGTLKTAAEGSVYGGRARIDGRITPVPFAWKTRSIPFADGLREAQTIPWGDVASAFHTTGIPNIETYLAMPPADAARMRRMNHFAFLLRMPFVLRFVQAQIAKHVHGPDDAELANGRTEIWGEVRNDAGRTVSMTLTTPNAYRLTALSAVAAVERVLEGNVPVGFQTPARAFGPEFVLSLPGVTLRAGARR
jgi:short subunit dehydrogenase-like uncharacterized protein